ncbi:MAG: hypothetical protein ACOX05_01290 [Bacillota bacterium]|jgi:hypothetical protein
MAKVILGIQVDQRKQVVQDVQTLLTEYGCSIKTRLGIHPAASDVCSQNGLILVELLEDTEAEAAKLEKDLAALPTVVVKKMIFE